VTGAVQATARTPPSRVPSIGSGAGGRKDGRVLLAYSGRGGRGGDLECLDRGLRWTVGVRRIALVLRGWTRRSGYDAGPCPSVNARGGAGVSPKLRSPRGDYRGVAQLIGELEYGVSSVVVLDVEHHPT
jgi:hypothetical protein